MTTKLPLLIGVLILSACGASTSTSQIPVATTAPSASAHAVPGASATASPLAGLTSCGGQAARGILGAAAATATNPDGSAKAPTASFPAATTSKLIVALAVQGLPAGTKLSFVRYLDGTFVDTRSAVIAKQTPYFYFTFTSETGKHIATGKYLLRLYVNQARACTIDYAVV